MTAGSATSAHTGGVALLERALAYTLGSLRLVTPGAMSRPTPCGGWDVRALLTHMDDSLRTLQETIVVGSLRLEPGPADDCPDATLDPVGALRSRACSLLGAWAQAPQPRPVRVGGRSLPSDVVAATGAVEVAVHGWDVARACGHDRRVPAPLARELLDLCPLVVARADRPGHFAPPVDVPPHAPAGEHLVAFLGRDPR